MICQRELEPNELAILDARIKGTYFNFSRPIRIHYIVIFVALNVACWAAFKMHGTDDTIALFVTTALYNVVFLWIFVEDFLKKSRKRRELLFIKSNNKVTAVTVSCESCVLLVEEEDEGNYYMFQLAGDKIIYFGSEDLSDENFPNNNFEIVTGMGPRGNILFFELFCSGAKIEQVQSIAGDIKWAIIDQLGVPNENEYLLLDGNLAQFIAGFKNGSNAQVH